MSDLGIDISDYVSLQGLFTRPNIFLDRKEIKGGPDNLEAALEPFIEELMQDGSEAGLFCALLTLVDSALRCSALLRVIRLDSTADERPVVLTTLRTIQSRL